MKISAKIIAHSVTPFGKEIVTVEALYPRYIHGEVMTHRVFSRNAMSSRAIPVEKMLSQVLNDPVTPIIWGSNKPGMQAGEALSDDDANKAYTVWKLAAMDAAEHSRKLQAIGLHKQWANRLLEPFQWMRTLITSTEWDNFYELRCHPDAQPEFQALATAMREAHTSSVPVKRSRGDGIYGWHLPYIRDDEREAWGGSGIKDIEITAAKVCAARCARVSYLKHDGTQSSYEEDINLFNRLAAGVPIHASPLEHAAYAMTVPAWSRNFHGWRQFRETYEDMRKFNVQ